MNKKFILNADDFGMTEAYNKAVLEGYNAGLLGAASLCANGVAFDEAINYVIPKCPNLSIGVHLNIIEGRSLTYPALLTDENGDFNNGYIEMILKSYNKKFLSQVENEFRAQIEKIISKTKVSHIDSHVHTHAIPNIFKITTKLAQEYDIPYIRTQCERPYLVPSLSKHFNKKYPPNILKIILLNTFTMINKKTARKSRLFTNDYLIGVGYTGMMDDKTVEYTLKSLENKSYCLAEALIHPCDCEIQDNHYEEFLITQNEELKNKIENMGFVISNHCFLEE